MSKDKSLNAPVYSKKIKIPKFEPDERNVNLEDCVSVTKYIELIGAINGALESNEITEYEAKFLKLCATRWIKFDYENVAQYYATKANEKMQNLLEKSTMVLIDVDKAFENSTTTARNFVDEISNKYISNNLELFERCNFSNESEIE